MSDWSRVEQVFDAAMELPPDQRLDHVRSALAGSPELEAEVIGLIAAATASDGFLEPSVGDVSTLTEGTRIGDWRVAGLIGSGGMGQVYRVQRADGTFEQDAALKIMRALPPAYWARFQAERQILANLEHPGVARLLDGGLGPDNRPFMVMEFVEGAPVDAWAAERRLDATARVRLILQAAEAVAHAHAKLVVHRDIKPSNILVTGDGRTRLIDFGVARLMTGQDARRTETPISVEYVAPELLEGQPASVMTDVYGLGATLYELLCGRAPIPVQGDAIAVAVRRIAEATPPPVSSLIRPALRDRGLARDLDAILARALRKEPGERYSTVEAFAEDLRRALAGQAVQARSGEGGYAVRRFLRRRRWPIAAGVAIVASLSVGLGLALHQAQRAERERDIARQEQARIEAVQQYLYFMLRNAADSGGPDADASQILNNAAAQVMAQFETDPEEGGPILKMLGELYFYLNDYEAAVPILTRLAESERIDPALRASARYDLAQVRLRQSDLDQATALLAQAQAFWNGDPVRWRSDLVASRLVEARVLRDRGEVEAAVQLLQGSLPQRIAISGANHRETGIVHNDLGVMLVAAGRPEEALPAFRSALAVWTATGLETSPDALNTLNNLAALEVLSGRPEAAEPLFRRAVEIRRRFYGPSAATAALLSNYGKTLVQLDRAEDAVPILQEASTMARETAGPGSLHFASATAGLSEALIEVGRVDEAADIAEAGLNDVRGALGAGHPGVGVAAVGLGRARAAQGRDAEARALLDQAETDLAPLGPAAASQIRAIAQVRTRYGLE
ncbi:MAG: serine/threonine protein kinase [Caulobacterales bacterium]|nr:serine/threonine protein kinase [Caulobacterales bacterium]